jgi:methionine-rich copper-binding protein CopC
MKIKMQKSEPEINTVLTQEPTSIRLFFDVAPNPDNSAIILTGPSGNIPLIGLHTMGRKDLMIMINQRSFAEGKYTVFWQTSSFENSEVVNGEYSFSIIHSKRE